MAKLTVKSLDSPDETRAFDKGKLDLAEIEGSTVGRIILQPGWKWSENVKPIEQTEWCEASHFQYQVSGILHVKMTDGTEMDIKPGDLAWVPPGHDGWVVGSEPVVAVDFQGMADYAKPA